MAPTSINATNTTSQATISWSAASDATSYNVYRSTTTGVTKANGTKFAGAVSPFPQSGLANGTTYYYVVTAVNTSGESPESCQVSATPIAAPAGACLAFLKVMAELDMEGNVQWNGVTGATSYNVYYSALPDLTPQNGTKVSIIAEPFHVDPYRWRVADSLALIGDYFIVTAVNSRGESVPSPVVQGPAALNPNRYLPTPLITHAHQVHVAANDFLLDVTNQFADYAPVVFIGTTAPGQMSLATVYYAKGYGSTGLGCYNLADSMHDPLLMDNDVGDCTIYGLDWTLIKLGTVTPTAGVFTVTAHGLRCGDTVYVAACPGNTTLKSGAYLVRTTDSQDIFTLDGANITHGDSINYLAKVNSSGTAVGF